MDNIDAELALQKITKIQNLEKNFLVSTTFLVLRFYSLSFLSSSTTYLSPLLIMVI